MISEKGLKRIQDHTANHTNDNVLLEYEMALKLKEAMGKKDYILPVLVGESNGSTLTRFSMFSGFPDSILPTTPPPTAISLIAPVIATAVATPSIAAAGPASTPYTHYGYHASSWEDYILRDGGVKTA